MTTRIGINGFGRIGRGVVRAAVESGADVEIVAVNDVADAAALANLLAYDSIYGRFPGTVTAEDGVIHAGHSRSAPSRSATRPTCHGPGSASTS